MQKRNPKGILKRALKSVPRRESRDHEPTLAVWRYDYNTNGFYIQENNGLPEGWEECETLYELSEFIRTKKYLTDEEKLERKKLEAEALDKLNPKSKRNK